MTIANVCLFSAVLGVFGLGAVSIEQQHVTGGSTGAGSSQTNPRDPLRPDLGIGANMRGYRPFPANNPWNTPIDHDDVDPNSATLIASIGLTKSLHPDFGANYNGGPFGIPYMVVDNTTQPVAMQFQYADQSDPGPYPFPPNAPIEGGSNSTGDRHVLIINRDNLRLYETYSSYPQLDGSWQCGSGAIFNLVTGALRPMYWTSADAAGLPIFPGLVRYDQVSAGAINHALRFTVNITRHAFVAPARHWASSNTSTSVPPMGMRVRLKASFDMSTYPADDRVILTALKKYGMMVSDNGGDWFLSGAPDARWNDDDLNLLKHLHGSDFEVVKMGQVISG